MLFRLCLHLGAPYVHPDVLAAELTDRQVDDWLVYADVENFGGPADDYRAGLLAWAACRGTKLPPDRFVPVWSSDPPTPEEYLARARAAHARAAPR